MPDPRTPSRSRVPHAEPAATPEKATGPLWARATHFFYDPVFDLRSRGAFQEAINDYVELPEAERAFHDTHLLFRVVQGLESLHGLLTRIEAKLTQIASPDLSPLEHLEPIRQALEDIASQPSLIAADGFDGDEEPEEDDDDLGEEPEEPGTDEDPDFIYDSIPQDEPEPLRPPRRAPPAAPTPASPPRPTDPEREALVGDLVPATEGPHGEAGDR